LRITAQELDHVVPLPPPRGFVAAPAVPMAELPRTNRLAVAAFVTALAGILLFGVLTGLVAIVLGSLALGAIRKSKQKGLGFALVGVLLGLGDMVGWVILLTVFLVHQRPEITLNDFQPDLTAFENLDPTINRAMRANVMIESTSGWGPLKTSGIGSGVIMQVRDGEALIITNRHVVDPGFSAEVAGKGGGKSSKVPLQVQLVDQSVVPGTVTWIAPDGIDLALVKIAFLSKEAKTAQWKIGRPRPPVGATAFAIGNPQGLGWTHTQGAISQYRIHKELPIIQTQTVINPGNSGGGLYDKDGFLIGINTWTQDKRVSEGLNFAISLDSLATVNPPGLDLQAGNRGPHNP
jgi:S1-C subfamily serine protease